VSVSDLMKEGYFARSHLTGTGMALLTSCNSVLAASESGAVLLQESFLISLGGAAGAELAAAADLGGEIGFTIGGGVVAATIQGCEQRWAQLLRSLTVNSLSYFVKNIY
jgi:hypothetical protein